jgi:D-alanine-D-alanine ligase
MKIVALVDRETVDAEDPQFLRRATRARRMEYHVIHALRALGHTVRAVAMEAPVEKIIGALRERTDLVFNITEHFGGDRAKDMHIAALLELLELPYTGSAPATLLCCRDKAQSKELVRLRGLPVPEFAVIERGERRVPTSLPYPVLVKPLDLDASECISKESLARNPAAALLRAQVVHLVTHRPAICEQFIEGRELKVAIVGNRKPIALPPREVVFGNAPPFLTSRIKDDREYRRKLGVVYPRARLTPREHDVVADTAIRIYRALGIRDYGKIDLRLTPGGEAYFIEANPNPDLSPTGFGVMAAWGGIAYGDLIGRIVALARRRG